MPIITHTDGMTNISQVIFVGPDRKGLFPVYPDEVFTQVPCQLDPLLDLEVTSVFPNIEQNHELNGETIELDYTDIHPTKVEQTLRVTGLSFYRTEFSLSHLGDARMLGKKDQPQPQPHVFELISFAQIRPEGQYRRMREGDRPGGRVIGWESHGAFSTRKENCPGK